MINHEERAIEFKKEARKIIEETIAEHRVMFASVIVGVGEVASQSKPSTVGGMK